MANFDVNAQLVTAGGLNPTLTVLAASDVARVAMEPGDILLVKNDTAGSLDLTAATPGSLDGVAVPDKPISIPATSTRYIGRLTLGAYRQDVSGVQRISFTAAGALSVALLRG